MAVLGRVAYGELMAAPSGTGSAERNVMGVRRAFALTVEFGGDV